MKEIEERYDRAQQRKELAEPSKGCQSQKKERATLYESKFELVQIISILFELDTHE